MLTRIFEYFRRQRDYKRTYNELSRLTTRELEDIGVHRGMISRLAYEHAYGAKDA